MYITIQVVCLHCSIIHVVEIRWSLLEGKTLGQHYDHTYLRLEVLHVFGGCYPQQHSESSETVLGEGLSRDLDGSHHAVEQLPEEG